MALYQISGIGCCCNTSGVKDAFGQIELDSIGRRSRAERRARRSQRRARRKERRNRRKYGLNCKGRIGAKIALAVPRKAFLVLVRLNFKKFAVKLHNLIQNPETHKQLMEKWCRLGGKADVLRRNVDKAYNKYKRKKGISGYYELDSVGEPVSTATIIASATAIITALLPLLKKNGEVGEPVEIETNETETSSDSSSDSGSSSESIDGMSNSNMFLIGAGIIGAYYLLKKKK